MDKIYSILSELRPEFDYHSSEDFIEDGMLDSFDMISLVNEIESQYHILIDSLDIVPENFSSAERIAKVIQKNGGTV